MRKFAFLICTTTLLIAATGPAAFAGGDRGNGEVKGCLSQGYGEGWYVLTKHKEDKTKEIKVLGDDSFAPHVGHKVKLTGEWKKGEDNSKYLHATGMEHIAATCP